MLKPRDIKTIVHFKSYIRQLAKHGLLYHWDDPITSITWSRPINIAAMQKAHAQVWALCDPWKILESDKALAKIYGIGDLYGI